MARILVWCLLPLTAFAGGYPEALSKPGPTLVARAENPWRWPAPKVFTATYQKRSATRAPFRLLTAELVAADRPKLPEDAPFPDAKALEALFEAPGDVVRGKAMFLEVTGAKGTTLVPLFPLGEETWGTGRSWDVVRQSGSHYDVRTYTSVGRVTVASVEEVSAASDAVVTDWTYAATLLQASGPLYVDDEKVDGPKGAWGWRGKKIDPATAKFDADFKAALDAKNAAALAGLSRGLTRWDERWQQVIGVAEAKKDDALLLTAYRRFRPMGRCSMDSRPATLARAYAEVCDRRGDLGCFLQLMVRIMGDQFERVAWSSYGEAAHGTQSGRLAQTGIDVERFFTGLLFRLPDTGDLPRPSEIDPWRLARAIREAGLGETFEKKLPALAADASVDPYNRLRATMTWVWLMEQNHFLWADQKQAVAAATLHPAAKQWFDTMAKERDAREAERAERAKKVEEAVGDGDGE